MDNIDSKIGSFWSTVSQRNQNAGVPKRWWQSDLIRRHVNRLVANVPSSGLSDGLIQQLVSSYPDRIPFGNGISVGGGNGKKEAHLIRKGIVQQFDIFELSEDRIEDGEKLARKLNIADQLRFIRGDAFALVTSAESYDLVHWNNSLHHMLDTERAVQWSRYVLKKEGVFYMDDFVGANRFQWPDFQLELALRVRKILEGTPYLRDPKGESQSLRPQVGRPDPHKLAADDPSEAADSERILEMVARYFPNAKTTLTGGVVYHLALKDAIENFDEQKDRVVLELLMLVDELCTKLGHTHYATALATKD